MPKKTNKILDKDFFERLPVVVAEELLGKYLVRRDGRKIKALMIVETEAYGGANDLASHARSGKTKRNFPMWGAPGRWYVYFTYGMHHMLNVSVEKNGVPGAVLIRGVEEIIGPARLTKFLEIDKSFNNLSAAKKNNLWIEDREIAIPKNKIKKAARVGIDYAPPKWRKKLWRFILPRKLQ